MTNLDETELKFVQRLVDLWEDAGSMAALRRGLKEENIKADPRVVKTLNPLMYGVPVYDEDRFYLVAVLFAMVHTGTNKPTRPEGGKKPWERDSLGSSFRHLRDLEARRRGLGPDEKTSVDVRFIKLLDSDPEDLPNRLRHALRLLASRHGQERTRVVVDWIRLLRDLRSGYFDSFKRFVQEEWARDYWRRHAQEEEQQTKAEAE